MVARQHPGEAMAEWFVEGFLNRLTDPHDAAAMRVLEHAVFYVVSLIPLLKLLGRKQRAAWVVHEPFLNLAWWLSRFFSPLVKLLQPVKLSQLVTLLQTDKKSTHPLAIIREFLDISKAACDFPFATIKVGTVGSISGCVFQ